MPDLIYCPECRRPQRPREESHQLLCPECAAILHSDGSEAGTPAGAMVAGPSALDEVPSHQSRPTGAMTLLRNNLRSEETFKQNGWLENLLPRRGKAAAEPEPSPANRGRLEPEGVAIGKTSPPGSSHPAHKPPERPSRPSPMVAEKTAGPPIAEPTVSGPRGESAVGRVSVIGVLAIVAVGATASVALLRGMGPWASVLFLLTVALLGASIVGILHRRAARRAFWQGFALFGCGYLLMAFVPSFPHQAGLELPTSRIVRLAHAKATASAVDPRDSFRIMKAPPVDIADPSAPSGTDDRPSWLAPGDIRQFMIVGHCLSTLLAALIGSAIARWFYRSSLAFP